MKPALLFLIKSFNSFSVRFPKHRVKAGALYYAVVMALIVTLLTSFIIIFNHYGRQFIETTNDISKVTNDISSAFVKIMNDNIVPGNSEIDVYEDGESIVLSEVINWGAYNIITIKSTSRQYPISKSAIIGKERNINDRTCLYISDHNNYLNLCGNTKIEGKAYLPKLGVKRAYIEGKSYSGRKLIYGKTDTSSTSLPDINSQLSDFNTTGYESVYLSDFRDTDTIYNPFTNKGKVILVDDDLSYKTIIGKIVIESANDLFIPNTCSIKDAIIKAPGVIIDKNFTGQVQIFASDSIFISPFAHLAYPSFVILNPGQNAGIVVVKSNAIIEGGICLKAPAGKQKRHSKLKIENDALITGTLYSNDFTELSGEVKGSVYTDKFILSTGASVYENHLLDAKISSQNMNKYFVNPIVFNNESNYEIIKWVN